MPLMSGPQITPPDSPRRVVRLRASSAALVQLVAALFATLVAVATSHAQVRLENVHPNLARGAGADKTMERYDSDRVNLLNGNLSTSIPLGIQYPLSERLTYAFVLNYNSNVWDFNNGGAVVSSAPIRNANAGLGWDLGFGRLIAPYAQGSQFGQWVYVSPDGAYHPFYTTMHYNVPEPDPSETFLYTRDGSLIRMWNATDTAKVLAMPDNTWMLFERSGTDWRVAEMGDRLANKVRFTYEASAITVDDNHGRRHRIYLTPDPTGTYPALVDRVELAAFNETTAVYRFAYRIDTVTRPSTDTDPATAATASVPVLVGVTLPDGSRYSLEYHGQASGVGTGRLASMQSPLLGRIAWTYATYAYTGGGRATGLDPVYRSNIGVATRRLTDAAGSVLGQWTYQPLLVPTGQDEREMRNTVVTPAGDKVVYFFNVTTRAPTPPWTPGNYGLPGSHNYRDSSGTRILAWRVFDCASSGSSCQMVRSHYVRYEQDLVTDANTPELANTNRREASTRTVYHDDVANGVERFAEVNRSEYDGIGHFRRTVTGDNFASGDARETYVNYDMTVGTYGSPGFQMVPVTAIWLPHLANQVKVTEVGASNITDFCFDRRTGALLRSRKRFTTSPTGGPSPKDVVAVRTYDAQGQLAVEQFYGGDAQGVGTDALCSLALPATDSYQIRHSYQYGVRASSQYYGANGQPFGPLTLDATIDRNSGRASSTRDSAGLATSYTYDAFGRPLTVRPQAGHGTWTLYTYFVATGTETAGARTAVETTPNGGGAKLTSRYVAFDGFGNEHIEAVLRPGSVWAQRYVNYDAQGWLMSSSEMSSEAPRYTIYLNHDPFGRERTIRPPEGSHHDVTLEYRGERSVKRTVPVGVSYSTATGAVNEAPRSETTVYDGQGRAWMSIAHTVDGYGSPKDVVTTSVYDVAGRQVQVYLDGTLIGTSSRYDGRGFLAETYAPDTGSGHVSVSYEITDARGHAVRTRRINHAKNEQWWLLYDRDRAERLTTVRDGTQTSKVWKEFVYADSNATNDWRAGRLWKTRRYNDMSQHLGQHGISGADVRETYTYGGPGGRVSQYETEFSDTIGRVEKFVQTYGYTELGEVKDVGYPVSSGGYITLGRNRTVTYDYSNGFPTAVGGSYNGQTQTWLSSVSYHPSGLVHQVAHANGVTYTVGADPNGVARPSSFATSGAKNPFTHGPDNLSITGYEYDGAGNLVKAGDQFFVRPDGYTPPAPTQPVGGGNVCDDGWEDPLGMIYASNDDQCNARIFYYYTADDRLFKIEDGLSGTPLKTWSFYDLSGRLITELSAQHLHYQPWWNTIEHTRDLIYGASGLVATHETFRDMPARTRHFHSAQGATGMRTDENGYRKP